MVIAFDMDGTLANLYGVDNWLDKLRDEDVSPYLDCEAMVDMYLLNELFSTLRALGHVIEIISWTSKIGSASYNKRVRSAKIEWLTRMGIIDNIDHIHIVKHGTSKNSVERFSDGIIFDDDEQVREKWTHGEAINPTTTDIIDYLINMVEECD